MNSTERRTIYIIPEDSDLQISCPAASRYCYHFQDVLSNSSYFLDSNTTLELLPGAYNITEKVGQLVLADASNFTLRGLSPNVTITCQPGATFGLTILESESVEISNIQISHCSANLLQTELVAEYTVPIETDIIEHLYLEYNLSSCKMNANSNPACHTSLTSFKSRNITVYETSILHSKGVGILNFDSRDLDITRSYLAYNQINCISFVLDNAITNQFLIRYSLK